MFKRPVFAILLATLMFAGAGPVLASGYSGGGGGGGFSGGASTPPREVDQVYEYGKSLYLGRAPEVEKTRYCVKVDGEPKKLRGRTLKAWRGSKQLDFANALYDCDSPEELALLKLNKEQVSYVLYYLNKRYKLLLDTSR